jgi:hypothetical protein
LETIDQSDAFSGLMNIKRRTNLASGQLIFTDATDNIKMVPAMRGDQDQNVTPRKQCFSRGDILIDRPT